MAAVLTLPEICESCRREVQALERVVVALTREEKRVARVTFRESVGDVYCMGCRDASFDSHHAREQRRGK